MSYYLFFHSNAISVTSIYLMHRFIASTLCRLLHGMTCFILLVSIVAVLAMLELHNLCLVMILVVCVKSSHSSSDPLSLVVMTLMVVGGISLIYYSILVMTRDMLSSIDLSGILMTSVCV